MLSKEPGKKFNSSNGTLVGQNQPVFLHIIDELKMGGAQTHLQTILREWQRQGNFKHVVVSLFGDGVIGENIRNLGIEVIPLNLIEDVTNKRLWTAQNKIYKLIKEKDPQIVEAHLTFSRLLGLFAAWRAGTNKRFAFEQGDIYFRSWKWRIANFIGQFFAQRIIVCSQALGKWVHETHGVFKFKLAVVYNCVDPSTFVPSKVSPVTRADFGVSEEAFVFCAVGTLGKGVNKRTDILVRAIAQLSRPDVYLFVCGFGDLLPDLEKLASDLRVEKQVKFLGLRRDIPDVMSISDAFCHAAPFEPFGIVCIEAMLIGLPVIIPDAGGIREIVENEQTGLKYPALDSSALADKMRKLVGDKQVARQVGQNGHDMVLKKMTVEIHVRSLKEIYGVGP